MSKLAIAICPGFHPAALTEGWVRSLPLFTQAHIAPALPIDAIAIFDWLVQTFGSPSASSQTLPTAKAPLIAIGFSAGVVGLTGALHLWQHQGGEVAQFFAVDGWGTPILGLPVCRLSHDSFTHWSSLPLGAGEVNFYADPSVDHLQLWGSPEQVLGRQVRDPRSRKWLDFGLNASVNMLSPSSQPLTAADFVSQQLQLAREKLERENFTSAAELD